MNKTNQLDMKKQKRPVASLIIIGLIASSLWLQSCGSDGKKSRTEEALARTGDAIAADSKDAAAKVKQDLNEAGDKAKASGDEAAANFKRERDEAVVGMKKQQAKLDNDIANLKADIQRQGAKAKASSKDELATLEVKRKALGKDIDKAETATAAAWQDIKAGFNEAGHAIGNAFDKAGDKMNGKKE